MPLPGVQQSILLSNSESCKWLLDFSCNSLCEQLAALTSFVPSWGLWARKLRAAREKYIRSSAGNCIGYLPDPSLRPEQSGLIKPQLVLYIFTQFRIKPLTSFVLALSKVNKEATVFETRDWCLLLSSTFLSISFPLCFYPPEVSGLKMGLPDN